MNPHNAGRCGLFPVAILGLSLIVIATTCRAEPGAANAATASANYVYFDEHNDGNGDFANGRYVVNSDLADAGGITDPGADESLAVSVGRSGSSAAYASVESRVLKVGGSGHSTEARWYGWQYEVATASASWVDLIWIEATNEHPAGTVGTLSVKWSMEGHGSDWPGAKSTLRVGNVEQVIAPPLDPWDPDYSWPDVATTRTDNFSFTYGHESQLAFGLSLATSDPRHAPYWSYGVDDSESWTAQVQEVFIPKGTSLEHYDRSQQLPFKVTEVPEPSTWAFLLAGLVVLAWAVRGSGPSDVESGVR